MRAGLVVAGAQFVNQACAVQLQREATFDIAFLREQHAPHIGVFDDRPLRLRRILAGRPHRAALRPLLGVFKARLKARHAQHRGAKTDTNARLVHHVEHATQALALIADEIAYRAGTFTKIEQAVGRAAITELVVQSGQLNVVALAG